jgi:hypothetical protein
MTSDVRSRAAGSAPRPPGQDWGEARSPRFIFVPALREEPEAPFPATGAPGARGSPARPLAPHRQAGRPPATAWDALLN